jgi:hypothetical protein
VARSDEAILANYVVDGTLKVIPRKRSRKMLVLHWLVERFERGRDYTEADVNRMIGEVHDDFATLRRELFDAHLMNRENGIYRRADEADRAPEA